MKLTDESSIRTVDRAMNATDSIASMLRMLIIATMTLDANDMEDGIARITTQINPSTTMLNQEDEFEALNDFLVNNALIGIRMVEVVVTEMADSAQEGIAERHNLDGITPEDFITEQGKES